jgi:serine/threonine protein kinase
MASIGPNTIIGGNWKVIRFLGEGACAKVYEVIPTSKLNDNLGYDVVAKVIPLPGQKTGGTKASKKEQERICNTLNYEYTLYTGVLYQFPFCPRNPLKFYGDDATLGVRYLVMERLEQDLVGFAKQKVPSPAQVADIGIQILEGLRWLHNKTFLFVDVKPDNFMLKNNKLYFVDCKGIYYSIRILANSWFVYNLVGLTERVQDNPAPGQVAFNGTPTFSSVSADQGNPLAYRDDVEALVSLKR